MTNDEKTYSPMLHAMAAEINAVEARLTQHDNKAISAQAELADTEEYKALVAAQEKLKGMPQYVTVQKADAATLSQGLRLVALQEECRKENVAWKDFVAAKLKNRDGTPMSLSRADQLVRVGRGKITPAELREQKRISVEKAREKAEAEKAAAGKTEVQAHTTAEAASASEPGSKPERHHAHKGPRISHGGGGIVSTERVKAQNAIAAIITNGLRGDNGGYDRIDDIGAGLLTGLDKAVVEFTERHAAWLASEPPSTPGTRCKRPSSTRWPSLLPSPARWSRSPGPRSRRKRPLRPRSAWFRDFGKEVDPARGVDAHAPRNH